MNDLASQWVEHSINALIIINNATHLNHCKTHKYHELRDTVVAALKLSLKECESDNTRGPAQWAQTYDSYVYVKIIKKAKIKH